MEKEKYWIGDVKYFQEKLVFGQIRQIMSILKTVSFELKKRYAVSDIIDLLGDHMVEFMSILLIPEGSSPKQKDNKNIAEQIEWTITSDMILEVMTDFFTFNQILELQKKIMKMKKNLNLEILSKESTTPSQKSPEETSPEESLSSGK